MVPVGLWLGCSQHENDLEEPLARVDNHYLFPSELQLEGRLRLSSLGEAAEKWVDRQVLLSHSGGSLVDHKLLSLRLSRAGDQIASQLLLDSLIYRDFHPSLKDVRNYYNNYPGEFIFSTDAALVTHVAFLHLTEARDALQKLRSSTIPLDSLLSSYNFDRQLIYRDRVISPLDDAIFTDPVFEFRGPITSAFGFHLLRLENYFAAGDTIPIDLIANQISTRLFQQRLSVARALVLDSLRKELDIEIYLD
ncbi:MAG TPA: peptidyl-prolyl cis-trans isomerase [bacterium]|nr:peptidyl-prolyl cis-trans isomerase [bacterium]